MDTATSFVNAREILRTKATQGRLTWAGPLVMVFARSVLALLVQALVTLVFLGLRHPAAITAAASWWQVTGTLVDLGCLGLLYWLTRREGIRLVDLIGFQKDKWVRDALTGLGILLVMFPVVMIGGSLLSGLLLYSTFQPVLPEVLTLKSLPLWAALYARLIWWVIWSVTEQMTYNGYALPRLQAMTGRTWLAVTIVSLGWAVQHAFLPFIPDGRVFLFLFIQMLPLVIVMQLLYLHFKRLPPLIMMHWGMDFFSAMMMISVQ